MFEIFKALANALSNDERVEKVPADFIPPEFYWRGKRLIVRQIVI